MDIKSVEIHSLELPQDDPSWSFALATYPVIEGWIVVVRAANGVEGHGYAQAIPHVGASYRGVKAALDVLTPRLVGRDCLNIEGVLSDIDAALFGNAAAKAGIDCALHDLAAKLLGVPLNALFGGAVRTVIPQIRIVPIKSPAEMAAASAKLVAQGYKYLKIKLKGDATLDVERIRCIRDAVGPDVHLTLDPNQSYTPKAAIQALTKMEPYRIDLVEQPVPADDLNGLALVTRNVPIAVEADESALSVRDVFSLVANRTVDAVSLKIPKLGGMRNTMLAARICEIGKVRYRLGATFGPRLHAAHALHLAAAFPRLDYACELAEFDHLQNDPYQGLPIVDGAMAVPQGVGAGVSLREGVSLAR